MKSVLASLFPDHPLVKESSATEDHLMDEQQVKSRLGQLAFLPFERVCMDMLLLGFLSCISGLAYNESCVKFISYHFLG